MEIWADTPMSFKSMGHPGATEFELRRISLQNPRTERGSRLRRSAGLRSVSQAVGAYNEDKIPMLLLSDWGQGNNCTLFMFNNVPSSKAGDPQYRNPRQSGNVRLVIDFRAAINHNITVLV